MFCQPALISGRPRGGVPVRLLPHEGTLQKGFGGEDHEPQAEGELELPAANLALDREALAPAPKVFELLQPSLKLIPRADYACVVPDQVPQLVGRLLRIVCAGGIIQALQIL